MAANNHKPSKEAIDAFDKLRDEIRKRQLSSSENFDKSILKYSSGGLAISLAVLKDFIPINISSCPLLLYSSWGLFCIAIIATITSFQVSYKAQENQEEKADRYYLKGEESAILEKNRFDGYTRKLNCLSGGAFIIALIFTTLFVSVNLDKAPNLKGPPRNNLNIEGVKMNNSDDPVLQKGLPTVPIQQVPASQQPATNPTQAPSVPSSNQKQP